MSGRHNFDRLLHIANAAFAAEEHVAVPHAGGGPQPFITISRQAGSRGRPLADLLAARLNAADPSEHPWTVWDRELVERAIAEHHISAAAVESVERPRRWWEELASNWSDRDHSAYLDEYQVYRRVAATIHALASQGRAIIVGRGGVYATGDLPRGLHLRVVAPFEARVQFVADLRKTSPETAAVEVRKVDHERDLFHRRFYPGKAILPEVFTLTLNSGMLTDEQMASCVLPLIQSKA